MARRQPFGMGFMSLGSRYGGSELAEERAGYVFREL